MKQPSILLLLPIAFLGFACERHSAESLPAHVLNHGASHEASGEGHASAGKPAAEAHKGEAQEKHAQPQKEAAAPVEGEAPKFFEVKPSK